VGLADPEPGRSRPRRAGRRRPAPEGAGKNCEGRLRGLIQPAQVGLADPEPGRSRPRRAGRRRPGPTESAASCCLTAQPLKARARTAKAACAALRSWRRPASHDLARGLSRREWVNGVSD
jgi:hypothetical protein